MYSWGPSMSFVISTAKTIFNMGKKSSKLFEADEPNAWSCKNLTGSARGKFFSASYH